MVVSARASSKMVKRFFFLSTRTFVMRDVLFEVAKRDLFALKLCFCPVRRGNRAGSSRNESDYSWRGVQIRFSLLESCSCENFGPAHFSIVS